MAQSGIPENKTILPQTLPKVLSVKQLGLMEYNQVYTIQKQLQQQRIDEQINDTLLFTQHPYVITLGTRGTQDDILAPSSVLKSHEVRVEKVERGGQATLHAPGQLVGYFIFHLYKQRLALRTFIEDIESILIQSLQKYGIDAKADENERGVWVGKAKIASIGISIAQGVSMHGFALNIKNNLNAFDWIIPCGMPQRTMTSVSEIAPTQDISITEIEQEIIQHVIRIRKYNDWTVS